MHNFGIDVFKGAAWAGHPASIAELHPPTIAKAEETFLKGMLETPWRQGHRSPAEWALSILLHIAIVSAVVLAPLFYTQVIDLRAFQTMLLVAPRPPAAAPPPATVTQRAMKPAIHMFEPKALMAPATIPAKIRIVRDEAAPPDPGVDGVIGGVPGGASGGVLGGIIGGTPAKLAPPPPAAKTGRILRVGGDIKAPRELYKPAPVYPTIAQIAHTQGVVIIEALINEHGDVVQAQAIDGPGLLIPAALAAVLKWKYEPTYLDGEPVSIRMHVEVKFTLR
ncbi:MAG TPA: energy transducer TonB [Candidatus Acidoferrales bacterium]|nr:energy transducer TonB [Candidatus Acidoferrales bacterium]